MTIAKSRPVQTLMLHASLLLFFFFFFFFFFIDAMPSLLENASRLHHRENPCSASFLLYVQP